MARQRFDILHLWVGGMDIVKVIARDEPLPPPLLLAQAVLGVADQARGRQGADHPEAASLADDGYPVNDKGIAVNLHHLSQLAALTLQHIPGARIRDQRADLAADHRRQLAPQDGQRRRIDLDDAILRIGDDQCLGDGRQHGIQLRGLPAALIFRVRQQHRLMQRPVNGVVVGGQQPRAHAVPLRRPHHQNATDDDIRGANLLAEQQRVDILVAMEHLLTDLHRQRLGDQRHPRQWLTVADHADPRDLSPQRQQQRQQIEGAGFDGDHRLERIQADFSAVPPRLITAEMSSGRRAT